MLDMTEALRPSELFALRWRSFDNRNTLVADRNRLPRRDPSLRQDPKEPRQGTSSGWPRRRAPAVEAGVQEGLPKILRPMPSSSRTRTAGSWTPDNYRYRVLKPLAESLGYPEAELPGPAPHDGDPGAEDGFSEGHPGAPAALDERTPPRTSTCRRFRRACRQMVGSVYAMLDERRGGKNVDSDDLPQNATNASEADAACKLLILWWAQQDSNLRLPPCEGGTLPLSYAPQSRSRSRIGSGV